MSLRLQLLAFVMLTLFLPWAGLRIVQQMEDSLRTALEDSLLGIAGTVATRLAETELPGWWSGPADDSLEPLYLHPLSRPPRVDGTLNDWRFMRDASSDAAASRALELGEGIRLWLGVNDIYMYLFVEVADEEIVHQAGQGAAPYGDRLALLYGDDAGEPEALLFANEAPGGFFGQPMRNGSDFAPTGGTDASVRGFWEDTTTGYVVEARVLLRLVRDTLGVGIIDSDDAGRSARLAASTWRDVPAPSRLIRERTDLARILGPYQKSNHRFRILNADGWVLADSGPLEQNADSGELVRPPIIERFFRYVLKRDDPEYTPAVRGARGRIDDPALMRALEGEPALAWYRRGAEESAIVAAAVPVDPDDSRFGAVLLEQPSDPILTLTNEVMLRLVLTTVLVSFVATAALLAYASLLSYRVGRLARAARTALGPRGEINARLPGTRAGDEIGALSRGFEDLLSRLREYTDYLQTLNSKLGHELRTPLAIVATSLDNLEHETATEQGRAYLARLRQGAQRLESILQAMTAATRVEQAVTQTRLEPFDLCSVVASCTSAYRDVYEGQVFEATLPASAVTIDGSADLIAQLLDKLVDNAIGFAREGTAIEIRLEADRNEAHLTVVNRGALLPEAMRHQLFDSLVSVRESGGDRPHLGLGLYIVTLVAEFHRGRVEAENLEDGSGVRVTVVLPRSDAGTA